tara:strand:- start:443 stop:649 length:207 start_codon:yes stop_codon:yes gene_type:complete
MDNNMIQNSIKRKEQLQNLTSSIVRVEKELEIIKNSIKQLIDKEIEELEELDRYANQQADLELEKESA